MTMSVKLHTKSRQVPVPNGTLLPRQIRRKLAVIIMILKSDDPDPRSFCLLDPEFQQGGFVKLVKLLYLNFLNSF